MAPKNKKSSKALARTNTKNSTTSKKIFEEFPLDILLCIRDFLPPNAAVCLSLSTRRLYQSLNVDFAAVAKQRTIDYSCFKRLITKYSQEYFYCNRCTQIHKQDTNMWPDFSSPRYHRLLRPAEFYDGGNPRNASGVIVWPNKSNWLPRPSDWTHQNKIGTGLTLRDNPTYEIYPVHVKLALEIACHWKLSSIRRRRKYTSISGGETVCPRMCATSDRATTPQIKDGSTNKRRERVVEGGLQEAFDEADQTPLDNDYRFSEENQKRAWSALSLDINNSKMTIVLIFNVRRSRGT